MMVWDLFITSFERGGIVMWPIIGVSVVVWAIGFDRLLHLSKTRRARQRFTSVLANPGSRVRTGDLPYDLMLARIADVRAGNVSFSYVYREFLLTVAPGLDSGYATMAAWTSAAPLLGLLGTVAGMIRTFEVIMEFGIGNPHLLAEGISIALLTTQAGLTVAFPAMLFHNFLRNKKNALLRDIVADDDRIRTLVERPEK